MLYTVIPDMIKNTRAYFVFFLFLISGINTFAQVRLSEKAHISVMTFGPWQGELYSAFGHSAFRVYDPANGLDEAYNYGVFDFDQPNFYLNFARGYLYYKLGVYNYNDFRNYYIYYNRFVHEQVLNFTPAQKQKVYDFLQRNALPENENYRYDYFYNNCATKLRDVLVGVLNDSIHFDGSYINTNYSLRELTDLYLIHQPWGDLGIDICLGMPIDKTAAPSEYMFLPDYVESGFDHAYILQGTDTVSLVAEKIIVYESRSEDPPAGLPHPLYFFGVLGLLGLILTVFDMRRQKLSVWFDVLLFSVSGLIGMLLFLLWGFTDHRAAAQNLNLLWAIPTNFIAAIFLLFKRNTWIQYYFVAVAAIEILVLLVWPILPQPLNYSLIPVIITLAMRAFVQFYVRDQKNIWTRLSTVF